jgi:hypothetical protein
MRKLRGVFFAVALATVLVVSGAAMAIAAPRPVEANNTPASGFAAAQTCNCHSSFMQAWQESMHAKALSDPLFKAKLAEANAASKGALGPFCIKCHGPVATMTGQTATLDPKTAAGQGISCTFCHQVTGPTAPTNNVALLVDPSGIYRAQLTTPTAPHPVAASPFHATSAICGSCHNVSHPGNGLPLEATYSEWQASPQAKAGIQCQDCHMSAAPGQIGPSMGWAAGGGPRRLVYQMNFMGSQVELGNPALARAMLQSAAELKLETPGIMEGAKTTSATVTIKNVGAGHNLPTGLTEIREMWLQVDFVAADGKVTELGKHVFGTVLKDAAGKYPAEMWAATGIQSDDRIPPMGSTTDSYKIVFPEGVTAGKVRAQLLYRSSGEALAKKAGVKNPVTVMAEESQDVYTNSDAQRASNAVYLSAAASSPLTPLVIAIVGMLACVALIIFFVRSGRKGAPKTPRPARGAKKADAKAAEKVEEKPAAEPEPAAAEPASEPTAGEPAPDAE